MLQYCACEKPLRLAKYRLFQVLCDHCLCDFGLCVSPSKPLPKLLLTITAKNNAVLICRFALSFSLWGATVPTLRLPSQKDTAISKSMDHLRSQKYCTAGTALVGLISLVQLFVVTTPTTSHSHKPICLVITIFNLSYDCIDVRLYCIFSKNLESLIFRHPFPQIA